MNGGSLFGTGTVNYGVIDTGIISPGDSVSATGKLAVGGTYTQSGTGALSVTIGGTTAGTNYDQLNVTSAANLNGTLNISLATGFTPTIGQTFTILTASSVTSTFNTVNGLSINSTEHFAIAYNAGSVVLTVVAGAATSSNIILTQLAPTLNAFHGCQISKHGGAAKRSAPSRLTFFNMTIATTGDSHASRVVSIRNALRALPTCERNRKVEKPAWARRPGEGARALKRYSVKC